jgi:hypothetical protein
MWQLSGDPRRDIEKLLDCWVSATAPIAAIVWPVILAQNPNLMFVTLSIITKMQPVPQIVIQSPKLIRLHNA